jgi:hypothetical protein
MDAHEVGNAGFIVHGAISHDSDGMRGVAQVRASKACLIIGSGTYVIVDVSSEILL